MLLPWLCEETFHGARSLDEDELRLEEEGRDDAPEAECRLYSFGEAVDPLDLSTLLGTASSDVEMWWECEETREALRGRDGLPFRENEPPSVCSPTLTICGLVRVCVPEQATSTQRSCCPRSLFPGEPLGAAGLQLAVISFMSSLRLADEPRQSVEKEVGGVNQGGVVSMDSASRAIGLCFNSASWTRRADGGL